MDDVKCYFDVSIGGQDCGRIIFKLFTDKCPKTCENFRCLCTGERGVSRKSGKPLHYKGTQFHRIVRNFIIQGGDITDGNGKGGDSIYDGSFADENLTLAHDEPYLLSMANRGPDTNKSQFFITTNEASHLDGKHVIFGRVVSGLDTILKIERQKVDSQSRPLKTVKIKDCGQVSTQDSTSAQAVNSVGRKRKLSTSSRSSDDSKTIRRSRYRSPSTHSSCSSHSSKCSSRSASLSSRSSRAKIPPRRHRRSPSCSQSVSSQSSQSSSSSSSSSDSSISSSENTCSSSSSNLRSRKRRKTNRRLAPTRKPESYKAPTGNTADSSSNKREEKDKDKDGEDGFVNPYYKCTVNLDEIPEVPVNRFLLRGPIGNKRRDDDQQEDCLPIIADLSKFEDIPDDEETINEGPVSVIASGGASVLKVSAAKPAEPLISKSGRIMKGRGTLKFRTPSPDRDSTVRTRQQSPADDRYKFNRTSYNKRVGTYRSRVSHSRSRSRERSGRKYSQHDHRDDYRRSSSSRQRRRDDR